MIMYFARLAVKPVMRKPVKNVLYELFYTDPYKNVYFLGYLARVYIFFNYKIKAFGLRSTQVYSLVLCHISFELLQLSSIQSPKKSPSRNVKWSRKTPDLPTY